VNLEALSAAWVTAMVLTALCLVLVAAAHGLQHAIDARNDRVLERLRTAEHTDNCRATYCAGCDENHPARDFDWTTDNLHYWCAHCRTRTPERTCGD